jgi:SAM-dependent methyltransferase
VGFSDWRPFAERLAGKLGYRNTYLQREPALDLCAVPPELRRTCDFVICSDVLEHVAPPVEIAIAGCLSLLKPGGLLVLTVPYTFDEATTEHFPSLREYVLVELGGEKALVNRTAAGRFELFSELVFHGGEGETLEMRLFALRPLLAALTEAGFVDTAVAEAEVPEHGVVWAYPWSLPIVARAPREA